MASFVTSDARRGSADAAADLAAMVTALWDRDKEKRDKAVATKAPVAEEHQAEAKGATPAASAHPNGPTPLKRQLDRGKGEAV